MTIRVRLALSFGLTLVLFCLNLVAYFVTSQSKDDSLRRLRTAAERRVQWGAFEHEIRDRWQEISVLSELPAHRPASRPKSRAASSGSASASRAVQVPDQRTRDRLTRITQQPQEPRDASGRPMRRGRGRRRSASIVSELGALKSEEDARVAEEASRLTDLTALMHRLSLIAFSAVDRRGHPDRRAVLALSHAAGPRPPDRRRARRRRRLHLSDRGHPRRQERRAESARARVQRHGVRASRRRCRR